MKIAALLLSSLFALATGQAVPELNRSAYLGHWYQVYSDLAVEATFENSSYCVTADYGLNPNGTVSVLNRERQYSVQGPERRILGWAAAADPAEPGQLTVHLQTTEFPAPYWVFALGPATYNGSLYEYSIVSDPFRLTLFVLARNLTRFAQTWQEIVLAFLKGNGFTRILNTPIATVQEGC
jgi:apolipoprotein D and lipocalin family protein